MLSSLYIRNFALIRELTVPFNRGLTIITGETGAGKSMLIGALNLVLGERASSDLVRSGENKAIIEAVISGPLPQQLDHLLEEAGIECFPETVLRRELSASGQSRCFINDTPCTASVLKHAGELLIDLHGQHDHQLLLNAASHEGMLDAFARTSPETLAYREIFNDLSTLYRAKKTLAERAREARDKRDMMEFQYNELHALDLKTDEEEELEREIALLENAETLFGLGSELGETLYEQERSAYASLASARHILEKLVAIDRRFENRLEETRSAESMIEDLYRFVNRYTASLEFQSDRLDTLRSRQLQLQRVQKKYHMSIANLIVHRDELATGLLIEETIAEEIARIDRSIAKQQEQLSATAAILSEKRRKAALRLDDILRRELVLLGIQGAKFETARFAQEDPKGDITLCGNRFKALTNGHEKIEFLFSANAGETLKPLVKAASGGEISRVMLALKSALAESTALPILVFDEIDTGISGATAIAVASSLKKLSRLHQIIAITHLPQIAAMADLHLLASKTADNDRTSAQVVPLNNEEHVRAIATLISGAHLSESSLKLARELADRANSV
ncbi:MAG: DNA repair protein RecN [Chlorobium sp.]|uniref:DNA repair protein RecN n=1 Tax=Chlorobium sp. TaxID=1095 RepID=UPI0025BA8FA0|nr:DNA repair protein RecN [Chlorobium sp.]MCF8215904.1 DNA repair protein RecN [Chlorobium sp.]MCF8270802.1 DNA repair protein RecN [Chlorobium sp.]MCF8287114.1 DNA repair protein RecN [Chlorobium sp.]MCF8290771.1 DNA repair protein RecN [Chlorobium sp.]MCF8384875.1 DNA repair protein RecN [Chlorobium sp.]